MSLVPVKTKRQRALKVEEPGGVLKEEEALNPVKELHSRLDAKPTPSPQPISVREMRDVPQGEYLHFEAHDIEVSFKAHFAVIKTADTHATLLVHETQKGTHAQFELRRRVLALGVTVLTVRESSLEIIKSIHAAHEAAPELEDTQVESKAWGIINAAITKKASDLHIETRGAYARVYFRIFGERMEQPSISSKSAMDMCNVLYGVHADSDNKGITWDEKSVKDAVIEHRTEEGQHVQLRLSSAPIHPSGNFHVVIRLLVMDARTRRPIEEMGYTLQQAQCIEEMLVGAQGAVLLVGPTNSGKSTSLQSFIERIFEHRGRAIKVITVERPVEYLIPQACQMGVPEARRDLRDRSDGSIFTTFVAATLRQDPDVVMVGEVNDQDSAQNIKQLVLSGRKTLSTLHVYEALSVFTRLRELGVPSSVLLMKGFIAGVVFQRLVPQLCPLCALPLEVAFKRGRVPVPLWERVNACANLLLHPVRVRGPGCEGCDGLSIVGRTVCAEVLLPDDRLLDLLLQGELSAARAHWQGQSRCRIPGLGVGALSHAIFKMRLGELDPIDIERWMGPLALEATPPGVMDSPVGADKPW
jgi:general secretion pathway protein E